MDFDELKNNPSYENLTTEELLLFKDEYLYEIDTLDKILIQLQHHLPTRSFKDLYQCIIVLRKHYRKQLIEINKKF